MGSWPAKTRTWNAWTKTRCVTDYTTGQSCGSENALKPRFARTTELDRGSVSGGAEYLIRGTTLRGWNAIAADVRPMRRPRPSFGVTVGPSKGSRGDCTATRMAVKGLLFDRCVRPSGDWFERSVRPSGDWFERSVRPSGPTLAFVRPAECIRRVWADVQGQTRGGLSFLAAYGPPALAYAPPGVDRPLRCDENRVACR